MKMKKTNICQLYAHRGPSKNVIINLHRKLEMALTAISYQVQLAVSGEMLCLTLQSKKCKVCMRGG